jgi:hypothetical protein
MKSLLVQRDLLVAHTSRGETGKPWAIWEKMDNIDTEGPNSAVGSLSYRRKHYLKASEEI